MNKNTKRKVQTRLAHETLEERRLLAIDTSMLATIVPPPGVIPARFEVPAEVAAIDGVGNNLDNPDWGSSDTQLLRLTTVEYGDGIDDPAGSDRPSAREISNELGSQTESITNSHNMTDLVWLWGQFIDHDIDLTVGADPTESFNIEVPLGDVHFDPFNTGMAEIELSRSNYDTSTGTSEDNPRQQINSITSFLDGSVIYGSDAERAAALRTFDGGRLATSEGDLLPFNTAGLDNAGGPSDTLFLAGDIRANENAALTAMHTVWVREHNQIVDRIAAANPDLSDEEIYQSARRIVVAELQAITYNDWLPTLMGRGVIDRYEGYDPTVNPSIANIFSTAMYRFGHSMLSSELQRLNDDGTVADEGPLALQDAFFAPGELTEHGIDSLLRGAVDHLAQEIDPLVIDDVRNFLFGPPGAGGFDLASLNIQRGRDHGLADYNQARIDYGLEPVTSFDEITSDPELAAKLSELYDGDVNNVDAWVGALAENHHHDANMGELAYTVIADQFTRIRDGDRFWYQNTFSGRELRRIESTSLADVIERNTGLTDVRDNLWTIGGEDEHDCRDGDRRFRINPLRAGRQGIRPPGPRPMGPQPLDPAEQQDEPLPPPPIAADPAANDDAFTEMGRRGRGRRSVAPPVDGEAPEDAPPTRGPRGPQTVDAAMAELFGGPMQRRRRR